MQLEKYPDKEVLIQFLSKISLFQKADKTVLAPLADKIVFNRTIGLKDSFAKIDDQE